MKNLYESLLDDFEVLSNNQNKALEHPWGTFWKDTNDGCNWETAVKQLKMNITNGASKVNELPSLKKGEVFVTFYVSKYSLSDKSTRIHVGYNRKDFEVLWKKGAIKAAQPKLINSIQISQSYKNNPHISFGDDSSIYTDDLIGYILSKEQAKKAIDMINKVATGDWEAYWESL